MTAIAIFIDGNEGYLIADSMISEKIDLKPTEENFKILMPTRGYIDGIVSEPHNNGNDTQFYVKRWGRKSVILPNSSGIFVWAGTVSHARLFTDMIYNSYEEKKSYDDEYQLSLDDMTIKYNNLSQDFAREGKFLDLTVLGFCTDRKKITTFTLGKFEEKTDSVFGEYFIAGTGGSLIKESVEKFSEYCRNKSSVTTKDLVEHICSRMLLLEHGHTKENPLDLYSGGFFAWWKISIDGVRPFAPYLRIYFKKKGQELFFNKCYLSEVFLSRNADDGTLTESIVTLEAKEYIIDFTPSCDEINLKIDTIYGVLIKSEALDKSLEYSNISGYFNSELKAIYFSNPIKIKSCSVHVYIEDEIKTFKHTSDLSIATIYMNDGEINISIPLGILKNI